MKAAAAASRLELGESLLSDVVRAKAELRAAVERQDVASQELDDLKPLAILNAATPDREALSRLATALLEHDASLLALHRARERFERLRLAALATYSHQAQA